jgi:hypothetical protein
MLFFIVGYGDLRQMSECPPWTALSFLQPSSCDRVITSLFCEFWPKWQPHILTEFPCSQTAPPLPETSACANFLTLPLL